jgi:exodeoxyribonuclease VII large subunit
VADLRAPTPSAAAELVVRPRQDLQAELEYRQRRLAQILRLKLSEARQRLTELRMHHVFQTLTERLRERAQQVDDYVAGLERALRARLHVARQHWLGASTGIVRYDFRRLLGLKQAALDERNRRLTTEFLRYLADRRNRWAQLAAVLNERSPLTILNRGYSITRDAAGKIVREAAQVALGDDVSIRLARGELGATVKHKKL